VRRQSYPQSPPGYTKGEVYTKAQVDTLIAALGGGAFPVGSVFLSVVSTNPGTLLGYGTWASIGAGKMLVGHDSGDADFSTVEGTGGAKTHTHAYGTLAVADHAAHTHSVTSNVAVADHAAHTHSVTSNVAVADHGSHTHSVTSNVAVADHASHTHTYTDVPNHVHTHNIQGGTTGATTGTNVMGSTATGGSSRAMAINTGNPTTGVSTGTTAGPNATITHTVTNNAVTSGGPSATLTHTVTNNAVTSGNPSATLTHSVTNNAVTSGNPSATLSHSVSGSTASGSTLPPYLVVYIWKRTA
jgi:hypothetical protein